MKRFWSFSFCICLIVIHAGQCFTKENVSGTTLYNELPDCWIDSSNTSHFVYIEKNANGDYEHYYEYRLSNGMYSNREKFLQVDNQKFREFYHAPKIAVDSTGNVHVVYVECLSSQYSEDAHVKYIKRTNGTWGTPITISSTVSDPEDYRHARLPDIYIDPSNDDIHVVWDQHPTERSDGTVHCIYWRVSQNGGTSFQNAVRLTDIIYEGNFLSWAPRIIVDTNHDVHLVYMKQDFLGAGTTGNYRIIKYTIGEYDSQSDDWDWESQSQHVSIENASWPIQMYYPSITLDGTTPYVTFVREYSTGIDQVYSYLYDSSWVEPIAVNSQDVKIILCEIEVGDTYVYVTMNQDNGEDQSKIYLKQVTKATDTLYATGNVLDTNCGSSAARLVLDSSNNPRVIFDDRQWILGEPNELISNIFHSY